MTHTDKITVVTRAIITKLQTDAALPSPTLVTTTPNADGTYPKALAADIVYGDQEIIPRSPYICVEPGNKTRNLEGAPQQVRNTFVVYILVYVSGPEKLLARAQCDELAEAVETLLHKDLQLNNGVPSPGGDIVIHGYCTNFESGYAFKPGLVRTVRIAWEGTTKLRLN
jgi:hypothetical protein